MPRPHSRHPAGLTIAAVAISACGSGDSTATPRVARVDSSGIEIVTSTDSVWTAGTRWTVSAAPVLVVGDDPDAPGAYQFLYVGDVSRRPDGTLVVVDGGSREVRLFDPSGSLVRVAAGQGEGPGDFGYPRFVRNEPGEGFAVLDRTMDRVAFDADGNFVGRTRFDRAAWNRVLEPLGRGEGFEALPDGSGLFPVYGEDFWGPGPPPAGPPHRPEITVLRVRPSGAADTLARIGGILQQFVDVGGGRASSVIPPFAPSGRSFVGRDGGVVVYDGALPEVHRLDANGTHRILRWTPDPEPVTPAEVEAFLNQQRNASWTQDRLPQLERQWAAMEVPSHKPLVTLAHPALDGSTWVRTGQYGPGPTTWRVFAADGAWLGSVELPGTFRPTEIGADYVLGVDTDPETEVETIAMFEVVKP